MEAIGVFCRALTSNCHDGAFALEERAVLHIFDVLGLHLGGLAHRMQPKGAVTTRRAAAFCTEHSVIASLHAVRALDAVPRIALLDMHRPIVIAVHELRGGARSVHGLVDSPVGGGDGIVGKLLLQQFLLHREGEHLSIGEVGPTAPSNRGGNATLARCAGWPRDGEKRLGRQAAGLGNRRHLLHVDIAI